LVAGIFIKGVYRNDALPENIAGEPSASSRRPIAASLPGLETGIREVGENCKMAVTRRMAPSGARASAAAPATGAGPTGEMDDDQLQ
jgi:hypothetical protein